MRKLICLALFVSLGFCYGCGGEKKESKTTDSNRQVAQANDSNKTTSRDSQTKEESRSEKSVDDADGKTSKTETASRKDDEAAIENRNSDSRRENSTAKRNEVNRDERSREKTVPRDNAGDSVVDADGDMGEEMEDDATEPVNFVAAFPNAERSVGLKPDNLIPEIEGKDLEGVDFRLSDYQGKVIMLDFWGDW